MWVLTVCYNEAGEEQLEEFMTEVQDDGAMSEQKMKIFEQLKDQQLAVKEDRAADIVDLQIAFDPRQSRVRLDKFRYSATNITQQVTPQSTLLFYYSMCSFSFHFSSQTFSFFLPNLKKLRK